MASNSIRQFVIKWKERLEPYYLLLGMLIFFIGSVVTIAKIFFSPPDLSIKIDKSDINYPSNINNKYLEIYNYIQDSTTNSYMEESAIELLDYLIKTRQQRIISIINNTNKSIRELTIRQLNVVLLTSSNISSSYLTEHEKEEILANMSFEKSSGIVYFKEPIILPPEGELKIYLWGQFVDDSNSVSAIYDGGQAKLEYSKTFSGFKAVFAENISPILFLLIVTFIIIYYAQTKKYVIDKKNTGKSY